MYVPIQLDHKCDQLNKLIDFFPFCHNNESKQKCIDLMKMNVHLITENHQTVIPPLQLLPARLLLLRLNAVCNIPLLSVIQHENTTPSTESDSQLDTESEDNFDNSVESLGSVVVDSKENTEQNEDTGLQWNIDDKKNEQNDYTVSESGDEYEDDDGDDYENDGNEDFKSDMFTGSEKENYKVWDNDISDKRFKEKTPKIPSKKKKQQTKKSAHFFGDL